MEEEIRKARNGDKEAFSNLMLLLKDDLYKIGRIRLKNDDDIYDVIQETMIIAFKSIKQLKKPQYFKSWIIRILINQINILYRKKTRHNIISLNELENKEYVSNNTLESSNDILDFNLICKKLQYKDSLIMILYYMEKFTDKEIGEILTMKENTVKTRRTRAKQSIKDILEKGDKIYG